MSETPPNSDRTGPAEAPDAAMRAACFAAAPDAIIVADANGRLVDANAAAEALLGYSHAELCAMLIVDLLPTPDSVRAKDGRLIACEPRSAELSSGGVMTTLRAQRAPAQPTTSAERLVGDGRWNNILESAFDAIVTVDEDHR